MISRFALLAVGALALAAATGAEAQSVAKGGAIFKQQCNLCHSAVAGQELAAPSLFGVVGRKAASDPHFTSYTPALKASKLVWTPANLDKFLSGPATLVPGTAMPITLANPQDRRDVVAYLASLKGH